MAAEADASAKDLAALLKRRMAADRGAAAECIPLVRRLGEPIESLQARSGARSEAPGRRPSARRLSPHRPRLCCAVLHDRFE